MNTNYSSVRRSRRIIAAALAVLFALALVLPLTGCFPEPEDEDKMARELYEKGVASYEAGDFAAAKQYFLNSGMYADSAQYIAVMDEYDRLYLKGVEAMDNKDYATAYSSFSAIPNYLNASEFIEHIDALRAKYEESVALYKEGKYLDARAGFFEADGYGSSAEYIANIETMVELYNRGMEYFNAGNYIDAITALRAINTEFEDSAEMIEKCYERLTKSGILLTTYIKNYNDGYGDAVRIDAGSLERKFSLRDSLGILFSGRTDSNGMISEISFGFTEEVRKQLGEEGITDALCHCIHALNPYITAIEDIRVGLYAYMTSEGSGYGSMWVHSVGAKDGALIIEVRYIGR